MPDFNVSHVITQTSLLAWAGLVGKGTATF